MPRIPAFNSNVDPFAPLVGVYLRIERAGRSDIGTAVNACRDDGACTGPSREPGNVEATGNIVDNSTMRSNWDVSTLPSTCRCLQVIRAKEIACCLIAKLSPPASVAP
jgi:hypothetical protein